MRLLLGGVIVAVAAGLAGQTAASQADGVPAPVFSSNSPLTFDFVAAGSESGPKPATVQNTGNAPLKISETFLGGRDHRDFRIASQNCSGATLQPSETCTLNIVFKPLRSGTRVATIRFADNTPCFSWITLAGSGDDAATPTVAQAAACETGAAQTPTPSPPSTTTPTPDITSTPDRASGGTDDSTVSAQDVISVPKQCVSRRRIRVRLKAPAGTSFKRVSINVAGRSFKQLNGKSIRQIVDLSGLPRGRFAMTIKAVTSDGKSFTSTRHYVTCISKGA